MNKKRDMYKILNLNKITFLVRVLTRYLANTSLITLISRENKTINTHSNNRGELSILIYKSMTILSSTNNSINKDNHISRTLSAQMISMIIWPPLNKNTSISPYSNRKISVEFNHYFIQTLLLSFSIHFNPTINTQ